MPIAQDRPTRRPTTKKTSSPTDLSISCPPIGLENTPGGKGGKKTSRPTPKETESPYSKDSKSFKSQSPSQSPNPTAGKGPKTTKSSNSGKRNQSLPTIYRKKQFSPGKRDSKLPKTQYSRIPTVSPSLCPSPGPEFVAKITKKKNRSKRSTGKGKMEKVIRGPRRKPSLSDTPSTQELINSSPQRGKQIWTKSSGKGPILSTRKGPRSNPPQASATLSPKPTIAKSPSLKPTVTSQRGKQIWTKSSGKGPILYSRKGTRYANSNTPATPSSKKPTSVTSPSKQASP